jgi:hypothetical protein
VAAAGAAEKDNNWSPCRCQQGRDRHLLDGATSSSLLLVLFEAINVKKTPKIDGFWHTIFPVEELEILEKLESPKMEIPV